MVDCSNNALRFLFEAEGRGGALSYRIPTEDGIVGSTLLSVIALGGDKCDVEKGGMKL